MQLLNLSLLSKRKQMLYTSSTTIKSQASSSSSSSSSTSAIELSTSAPAKMSGSMMAINMANINNNSSNSNRSSMLHSPLSLKGPTATNQTVTMGHHHYSFDFVSLLELDDDFHRTLNLVKSDDDYDIAFAHSIGKRQTSTMNFGLYTYAYITLSDA
ncbi:hypothetical protein DERF_003035 [Dermatophagoides farinae]|uniref:Uncharacterized protein n=1 Tax=Dermatophagoides farinae TaxID=6954 RepID=A0A922LB62_DERFA|nr:hypothetical protein DERF_003035 [Dermatophagoides farinae]